MRIALREDIPAIKEMAMRFLEVSGYQQYAKEHIIDDIISNLIDADPTDKILLYSPDTGFIAGAVTPFIFGESRLATEIAWWVNEDKRATGEGMKLIQAFEYWAKNVANCQMISMGSLDNKVEKLYKKNGYKLHERAYLKVF